MLYKNAYITYNNTDYFDYTLAVKDHRAVMNGYGEEGLILSSASMQTLKTVNYDYSVGKIPKGTSIYVAPGCKYASDDIRKYYKIKRDCDAGDYNVLPAVESRHFRYYCYDSFVVFPTSKLIVVSWTHCSPQELINWATSQMPEVFCDDAEMHDDDSLSLYWCKKTPKIYKKILDETVQKPIVSESQLDINSDIEVTVDLLNLVYNAAKVSVSGEAVKNLLIQLNVLNQHNWRRYPGTISLLLKTCNKGGSVFLNAYNYRKQHSKPVRELLEHDRQIKWADEKDFNLGQAYIESLLNIGPKRFTTMDVWIDKLLSINLFSYDVESMYKDVICITPKKYEDE